MELPYLPHPYLLRHAQLSLDFPRHCIYFSFSGKRLSDRQPGRRTLGVPKALHGDDMITRKGPLACNGKQAAAEVLQQFVCLFEGKGWLDRTINIRSGDARYRLFCSKSRFFAYRMNDSWGISPGVPGWLVCMVTHDQVFLDAETCAFPTEEPETHEWLRLLADNNFEVTQAL